MKSFLLGLLILSGFYSCAPRDGFIIRGKVEGKESGSISLLKVNNGRLTLEDSTTIKNGTFELKGKTDLPEFRVLAFEKRTPAAQFIAENGTIYVKINADSLNRAQIKGSKSNDEFSMITREMLNNTRETGQLQQRYMEAQQKNDQMAMNKATADYQALIQNQNIYIRNFIREHPKSTVSPLIALMQFSQEMTAHDIDTLVKFLDPSIQSSIYITELKQMADKIRVTDVGAVAPDFTQNTPEGSPLTLSSLRGKYVMIDFWASWCQPCRREMPNVVTLYNKYKDKGFDIIGVSLDKEKDPWVKAIADDKLTWHHVSDLKFWQNEAAVKYGIQSIPSTILLDKDGKIIAKNLRGDALAQKLEELLK
jgi:thiol-disulfide isomerase/thioredoxin